MYIVNLVFDIPLRQTYSYISNEILLQGARVMVELRGRNQIGFVLSCLKQEEFDSFPVDRLKPIIEVSPNEYFISKSIWELCEFAASYYHHPLGNVVFSAIPTILRKIAPIKIKTAEIHKFYKLSITSIPDLRGRRQQKVIDELNKNELSDAQFKEILGINPASIIRKWMSLGIIEECVAPRADFTTQALQLNHEQQQVVNHVQENFNKFHSALLYGITGSGKTEVFLYLIHTILTRGQQALILVPEINLTPQLAGRFQARFPNAIISLINSEISDYKRLDAWIKAQNGISQIVLGTRLSVFTQFKNLGIIIVDEEHDESFKQNDGFRYHARDLAIWRAKELCIPVILSSATPSLETLYNCKNGKYHLYKLTERAAQNAVLPQVELIHIEHYPPNYAGISAPAIDKLKECMNRKELALVFINRRGYAPVISCYDCGWVSSCQYCSSNMVYHNKHKLKCHHCGYQINVPPVCPTCKNQYLHTIGHGTQKLEEFLQLEFPTAKIKRVDRDTTSTKNAWQLIYDDVDNEEINILVGTQMLAKGHDFANLTLVIGLNLDNALFSYDFRASEDMFSTLTQVAGRAGRRDKPGQVLLQTHYPDHPLYHFLSKHNFDGFVNYTFKERKSHNLPPFSFYALVKMSSAHEIKLKKAMSELQIICKRIPHKEVTIFPAVQAVMYKLHNKFRAQLLISSNSRNALHNYLSKLETRLNKFNGITIAIDVDPLEV